MATLTSFLDEKASRMAEQVDGLGRETAESLHTAASSIRKGSQRIDHLAESTANKLDGAGTYVEKHNLKRAIGESRQLVGRYPVESLVLAAGVGFLTGFAMRRMTHACPKPAARASGN
jgi:ElaB/YqjD/DUF883 family membrane-anchored ribosome-binding protein